MSKQPLQIAKELLGNITTLPLLPKSAQNIIELSTDPFVNLSQLSQAIEQDPVISARLIGLANSAFFAQVTEITSVKDAIIRALGLDLTRGIAVGMACSSIFDTGSVTQFNSERFWQSSLTKSALTTAIAHDSEHLNQQAPLCSLLGLLSNIGLLAAAAIAPIETQHSLEKNTHDLQSEMLIQLGCNHQHITAVLAELWHLPKALQTVFLMRCDEAWASTTYTPMQACLYLSDHIQYSSLEMTKQLPTAIELSNVLSLSNGIQKIIDRSVKAQPKIAEIVKKVC